MKSGKFLRVKSIGWVTLREMLRDKVLYNTLVFALFLFFIVVLAAELAVHLRERALLDFGMAAFSLASMILATLLGGSMLSREFERRTALVILSKPVSRFEFLVGKYLGLCQVLFLNWMLLSVVYSLIYFLSGGSASETFFVAIIFVLLKSLLAGAVSLFFSSFTTTSLAVIFSFGTFLLGESVSQIRFLAVKTENFLVSSILNLVTYLIPQYEKFNLGLNLTYQLPITRMYIFSSILYVVISVFVFLIASRFFILKREI